jgi:uncharacterized protein
MTNSSNGEAAVSACVSGIFVYPIKSCRGISVSGMPFNQYGFEFDRQWMLAGIDGRFLSQRALKNFRGKSYPGSTAMAQISPALGRRGLTVNAPQMPALYIPYDLRSGHTFQASLGEDKVEVERISKEADDWFSEFLDLPCRLVCRSSNYQRKINPDFASASDETGLNDGFPFLLVNINSLIDLNIRRSTLGHGASVPLANFRPNIVINGFPAFAEDRFGEILIGRHRFRMPKPCARCPIIDTDQRTGDRPPRGAQLTLGRFRRTADGRLLFGENLVHQEKQGYLYVGDTVKVTAYREYRHRPHFVTKQ